MFNLFKSKKKKLLEKFGWIPGKKYVNVEYYVKDGFELEIENFRKDDFWYLFYPNNKDGMSEKCYLNEGIRFGKITELDFKNFDFWIEEYKESNV